MRANPYRRRDIAKRSSIQGISPTALGKTFRVTSSLVSERSKDSRIMVAIPRDGTVGAPST